MKLHIRTHAKDYQISKFREVTKTFDSFGSS